MKQPRQAQWKVGMHRILLFVSITIGIVSAFAASSERHVENPIYALIGLLFAVPLMIYIGGTAFFWGTFGLTRWIIGGFKPKQESSQNGDTD